INGNGNSLTSNGSDVQITAATGALNIGTNNKFTANGGNILLFAKGNIGSATSTGNIFNARSVGDTASKSTGGGIEIGSGLTTSANLSKAFALKNVPAGGINPAPGALGSGVVYSSNNGGVIEANVSVGGFI